MDSITSINPKDFFKFFDEAEGAVVMAQAPTGLHASVSELKEVPENAITSSKVRRADVLAIIKAIVAVRQGREVMFLPSSKGYYELCIGPKSGAKK